MSTSSNTGLAGDALGGASRTPAAFSMGEIAPNLVKNFAVCAERGIGVVGRDDDSLNCMPLGFAM
jgi:hypothetical protein